MVLALFLTPATSFSLVYSRRWHVRGSWRGWWSSVLFFCPYIPIITIMTQNWIGIFSKISVSVDIAGKIINMLIVYNEENKKKSRKDGWPRWWPWSHPSHLAKQRRRCRRQTNVKTEANNRDIDTKPLIVGWEDISVIDAHTYKFMLRYEFFIQFPVSTGVSQRPKALKRYIINHSRNDIERDYLSAWKNSTEWLNKTPK